MTTCTTDSVTLTLTLPVNAPLAGYVNAIEMAHALRIAAGDTIAAEALAGLIVLCARGHQALIEDHMIARDLGDSDSIIISSDAAAAMQDARRPS